MSPTAATPSAPDASATSPAVAAFRALLANLTRLIAGRALDANLDAWLNEHHGMGSANYQQLKAACIQGVAESWLCKYEGGGLRLSLIHISEPTRPY